MRAALRDEFSDIYVVNLLGDAMKSGDEYRREGDKIFGQGSRNGVQITVLVRNPDKDSSTLGELHYATVPEYSTRKKKFAWLTQLGDVTSDQFQEVPVNDSHDWVNLTDGTFAEMLAVCETGRSASSQEPVLVSDHSLGAKTNCDAYVYSFDYDALISKVSALIDAYEYARHLVSQGVSVDEATRNDELETIKWTHTLKQSLKNGEEIEFDVTRIRKVLYRPFTKIWLYVDHRILSQAKATADLFSGHETAGKGGGGGGRKPSVWQRPATGQYSGRWRPTPFQTFAQSEPTSQPGSPHGGDHDLKRLQHDLPGAGDGHTAGHSSHQGISADPSDSAAEAILLSSPSTRTTFGTLAIRLLPDLHALDPACRAIPRRRVS